MTKLLDFTLRELLALEKEQKALKTISEWKLYVTAFRDEHDLTDNEAIDITRFAYNRGSMIRAWKDMHSKRWRKQL